MEKRSGLLRCYISRVENGHTVPALETLEKMARALECPLYQLFYDSDEPPKLPSVLKRASTPNTSPGFAKHWKKLTSRTGSSFFIWRRR
jgi:transcriptional regulator with XRE-family HTH domain